MALGAASLLLLASAVPAPAAPPESETPIVLTADHLEYNTRTGVALADGQVRASRGIILITADHLEGNLTTGEVEALGHVTLKQGDRIVTGTALYFNFQAETGVIQDETTQVGPWHLTSGELELSGGKGVAYNASITPCDPQHPAFLVRARQIDFVPGQALTAHDASLFLFGLRVVTLSTYQYSLRRDLSATTGPRVGFDNVNGAYLEYSTFSPWGSASNRLTVRLGTTSGLTAQDVATDRAADHLWTVNLGRTLGFDQNGNLFSLDQYSLDLTYDAHRMGTWASYTLEGQAGSYQEIATGVSATRGEASLNVNSDAVRLTPNFLFIGSGEARFDEYGTGQERTVLGGTVGLTDLLDRANSLSLTYNLASVGGTTPFLFDAVSPDSTVALSYNYLGTGLLQGWGVTVAYSFLTLQTTLGADAALALSPTFLVSLAGSYNVTAQQWNEVDVAVNATCDCLSVGLLYRMFPQTPALNNLVFSVGLNPLASIINPFTQ
jgi:hypothetical protein